GWKPGPPWGPRGPGSVLQHARAENYLLLRFQARAKNNIQLQLEAKRETESARDPRSVNTAAQARVPRWASGEARGRGGKQRPVTEPGTHMLAIMRRLLLVSYDSGLVGVPRRGGISNANRHGSLDRAPVHTAGLAGAVTRPD
ncbi:unnamed protein product, partial [Boreogadus saida]